MKNSITKKWLYQQYWIKKLSLQKIAKQTNVSCQTIYRYMKKWKISRRNYSQASKIYFSHNPLPIKTKVRLANLGKQKKVVIKTEQLKQLYVVEQKTSTEIAKIFNCSPPTIIARLKEAKIKLRTPSERKTGPKNPNWGKRGEKSVRWGKHHSKKIRDKISRKVPKGKNHFKWKPPHERIECLNNQIRNCSKMKQWRLAVFKRDNFTCILCKKKRNSNTQINADHIVPFAKIKKRNKIKSLQEALLCAELWNINNGRTLCVSCHKKTKTWGYQGVNNG